MRRDELKVVSIWECDNCHLVSHGSYWVYRVANTATVATVEPEEPDGWWVSSTDVYCGECRPL